MLVLEVSARTVRRRIFPCRCVPKEPPCVCKIHSHSEFFEYSRTFLTSFLPSIDMLLLVCPSLSFFISLFHPLSLPLATCAEASNRTDSRYREDWKTNSPSVNEFYAWRVNAGKGPSFPENIQSFPSPASLFQPPHSHSFFCTDVFFFVVEGEKGMALSSFIPHTQKSLKST